MVVGAEKAERDLPELTVCRGGAGDRARRPHGRPLYAASE